MIGRAAMGRPRASFQRSVPDDIRALDTIAQPDYADLFTVPAATSNVRADTKQWARKLVDEAPLSMRLLVGGALLVQRAILGLRSTPHGTSDTLVSGWHIAARGDGWLRLEAGGRHMMTGHIVLRLDSDRITA